MGAKVSRGPVAGTDSAIDPPSGSVGPTGAPSPAAAFDRSATGACVVIVAASWGGSGSPGAIRHEPSGGGPSDQLHPAKYAARKSKTS